MDLEVVIVDLPRKAPKRVWMCGARDLEEAVSYFEARWTHKPHGRVFCFTPRPVRDYHLWFFPLDRDGLPHRPPEE